MLEGKDDNRTHVMSVDDVVREWWVLEVGAPTGVLPRGFNRGEKSEDEYMVFQSWCQARVNAALFRCGVFENTARMFLMSYAEGGGVRNSKWVRVVRDAIRSEMEANPWKVVM